MKSRYVVASLVVLACAMSAGLAFAQDNQQYPVIPDAKPMFKAGPVHYELAPARSSNILAQWNGSFSDLTGSHITFTMVGSDPSKTNVTTTIPVLIIPIKMIYPKNNGNHTFDPVTLKVSNGKTIVNNLLASPLFNAGVDFKQGGTDLGNTQYIDAYQRGNFWSKVSKNTKYHVLLGKPTVLAEQTITVSASLGTVSSNPFGSGIVGTYDINAFDNNLQTFMKKFSQINPSVLPLFVTTDIFLTQNGSCCIGGYHNANGVQPGGQTYSYATYENSPGSFSQDVSAFSHEIGEWVDDPFVDNAVNCLDNNAMEVGDPLENNPNFGDFSYTLGGFKYNLQSLVFIGYFGAPRNTSVHSWLSFQNDQSTVCPGQ